MPESSGLSLTGRNPITAPVPDLATTNPTLELGTFTGGYSDYLTAPDEAVITFHGNGYTAPERVGQIAALRRAEVTFEHGYKYLVLVGGTDASGTTSFTTPGYVQTYGSAFATGNFATGTATTTYREAMTSLAPHMEAFRLPKSFQNNKGRNFKPSE